MVNSTTDLTAAATAALRRLVGRDDADFRDGQLEAVRALVADRARVLVVQRTGWGKSAVYFVATALRRSQGSGPTLIVSPLLALMRDQAAAVAILTAYLETRARCSSVRSGSTILASARSNCPIWRDDAGSSWSTRRTASRTGGTTSAPTIAGSPIC